MQCANLLADGLACSEEVQEHEKMTRHQLVFFPIQFNSIEFLTSRIVLFLSPITLLSVHGTLANVHVVCSK